MVTNRNHPVVRRFPPGAVAFLVLLLLLLALFHRSALPGEVVFSNDSPLGVLNAQADQPLSAFTGYWQPLNWLGTEQPSALPNITQTLFALLGPLVWGSSGPVVYAKWYPAAALLILGMSAWLLGRQLGWGHGVALLFALGMTLNSDVFSHACWGLPSISLGWAATLLALAALAGSDPPDWRRLILAGCGVGLALMESYDVGAILSLYVAAFVLFQSLTSEGRLAVRLGKGAGRVALVAVAAALISAHALSTLVSTQVKGVSGMAQDETTRTQRWHEATQWSLPKVETLQLIVPGLFGYRMDTPNGGQYWGGIGRDSAWDDYWATRHPDPATAPRGALLRHSGAGFYAGALVVLLAAWSVVNSWRRVGGPYRPQERRFIWFWLGAALISLLLAYGRHAPFYQWIYQLPFFSTIRNPIKFLHPLEISLVILFGYGLQGLWRGYLDGRPHPRRALANQLSAWWRETSPADRRWVIGSASAVGLAAFAWILYATSTDALIPYLARVGFADPAMAQAIARFSVGAAGMGVLFLMAAAVLVALIMSGMLAGKGRRWAAVLAGLLLVGDLARANLPWIRHYDYREQYATNPVVDQLRDQAHQHRVTGRVMPTVGAMNLVNEEGQVFSGLYHQWLEHLFQFYRVQSLDIVQMPRVPLLEEAYLERFRPPSTADFQRVGRLWELTNTRYVLGMTAFLDLLNQQFDPAQNRFRVHTHFALAAKPGVHPIERLSQLTAVPAAEGPYALFEFTGALPRAILYPRWSVVTEDAACLEQLTDPSFNPHERVLVNDPIEAPVASASPASPGIVRFESYQPKRVRLKAVVTTPSVLLLNDRYHPDWAVSVNGERRPLLRCNHIMRGVFLEPGEQDVEFYFQPQVAGLFVSLAAILAGLVLLVTVIRHKAAAAPPRSPASSHPPAHPTLTPRRHRDRPRPS
jgi:hypothetical protein